ncbi:MAG: hypothetical protein PHF42_05270 [Pseudomonas sp.]|nr:hypothetical protein [Pseudomonas sp.]
MFGIILSIIGISLAAALAGLFVSYTPIDAMLSSKSRQLTEQGMKSLHDGSVRYIKSVTDQDGISYLPAPGTNLHHQLQPAFAFFPAAPSNMAWTVESGMFSGYPAISICLRPIDEVDPPTAKGVVTAKNSFPSASTFIGESCGATSNGQGTHLTYWVVARHHT